MRTAARLDRVPDIVVITGMSGSGRTQAMHVFEDMGYYCIDNLPPRLILDIANVVGINTGVGRHLAVTCDLCSQGLFDEMFDVLRQLGEHELTVKLLFLDCSTRSSSAATRRPAAAIPSRCRASRSRAPSRASASSSRWCATARTSVIDTSHMRTSALRNRIRRAFSELSDQQLLDVHVYSFGFKHGMPVEADLMIDVRFLPNPFYDPTMRNLTGNDVPVRDYVLNNEVTGRFLKAWEDLLDVVMPGYVAEGKSQLSIAVGCTGGQHRSVVIANETARYLQGQGYHVTLAPRPSRGREALAPEPTCRSRPR